MNRECKEISQIFRTIVGGFLSLFLAFCLMGCSADSDAKTGAEGDEKYLPGTTIKSTEDGLGDTTSANGKGASSKKSSSNSEKVLLTIDASVETAQIVSVVDGDTFKVKIDGQQYKVRLIGCDCPESVAPDKSRNCEEGRIASAYTKSLLKNGQTIYLTKDVSDTDKYGRLLRFAWLEKPKGEITKEQARTTMLNAILIDQGYAQAKAYKPDVSLKSFFNELEDGAVVDGRGVSYKWA